MFPELFAYLLDVSGSTAPYGPLPAITLVSLVLSNLCPQVGLEVAHLLLQFLHSLFL